MVKLFFLIFILFDLESYSNEELQVSADQFTYDKDNSRIFATGDVEIIDTKFKLNAEKVFLNNSSNVLSASDGVTIFNSDGSILKASKIVADQELKNAIIEDNFLYLPVTNNDFKNNYLRLAAKRVERRSEFWEKLENGVFTACEICFNEKKNKFDPPLIQLRAKKIIHDKRTLDVKYYDTFLDLNGKSIFYFPYFSHASPLVKRKAGFISPTFLQNHYFGMSSETPYYFPINNHHDITVKPRFSQKKNPALFIEHRKNFFNGEVTNEISGTIANNKKSSGIKDSKKRGHVMSKGEFDLSDDSYLDFQIHRTTDRNYLNTYKYRYKDTLDSFLKIRSHRNFNFYSFESYLFQDLRQNVNLKSIPKIFPRFRIELNSNKNTNSFNYETRVELINLKRAENNETKKLFFNQDIFFPTLLNDGTQINLGLHLNGGLYHIEKFDNPKNGEFEFSKIKSNFFPQMSIEISKPYVKVTDKYKTIIKPQFIFLKTNKNAFYREIPDESNVNNFDLDYYDLFTKNRLSGNDRFDNINRFDYGLSFLKQTNLTNTSSKIGIAQSYQLDNQKYLPKNSGINDKFSDILANIELVPNNHISLNSFISFDKDNLALKNAYSTLMFSIKESYLSFRNIRAPAVLDNEGTNLINSKNQFNITYRQKFSDFWSFTTSSTFDKKNKIKFHDINAKIKYEDECLGVSFNWKRQYTHNPEDPTSNTFLFLFSLKEIMENDI